MKLSKSVIVSLVLLIVVAALYRVMPNRPLGFAPQYAMAIFGGAIFINNKKWAFTLPILSLFISDAVYQLLYAKGLSATPGFYEGQWQNYLLIGALTFIGFLIKNVKFSSVVLASIASPTAYFLGSNFIVWAGGGGLQRPLTWPGLVMCYTDALPFYPNSVYATLVFSAVLFGGYYMAQKMMLKTVKEHV